MATEDTLVRLGRHLRRGEVSEDLRRLYLEGGRGGDSFYRDRWSHDKVVRSTHGVNCTGSPVTSAQASTGSPVRCLAAR